MVAVPGTDHPDVTSVLHRLTHGPVERGQRVGGAIGAAGLLNVLLRNSRIVPLSDMTGIIEFDILRTR